MVVVIKLPAEVLHAQRPSVRALQEAEVAVAVEAVVREATAECAHVKEAAAHANPKTLNGTDGRVLVKSVLL